MRKLAKPMMMGGAMGAMMLWMLHQGLTDPAGLGWVAIAGFVAIHVILAAAVVTGIVFAARLSPTWRARLKRLHRPSMSHLAAMLLGMATVGLTVHIAVHGGFV